MSIKISGTGSFIPKNIIKNDSFLDSEFYDKNGEPYPNSNKDIIAVSYTHLTLPTICSV